MEGIVYHGSPRGDLDVLKAKESVHQKTCIYATTSKVVALLFMGKGHGDLDTQIGTRDGILELVERRPGVLEELYAKEGFLYELDGKTFEHYDYLWSREVISFEQEIKPKRCIHIPNILASIEKEEKTGSLKVYRYPERPNEMPLDNSDLIEKYIKFENSGLKGTLSELLEVYPEFKERVDERLKTKEL